MDSEQTEVKNEVKITVKELPKKVKVEAKVEEVSTSPEPKLAVVKFLKTFEFSAGYFRSLSDSLSTLKSDVVELLNQKHNLEILVRDKKSVLDKVEAEHRVRIQGMSAGHKAMIDRLTEKEMALRDREARIELLERESKEAQYKIIALKEQLEAQATANRIKQTAGV